MTLNQPLHLLFALLLSLAAVGIVRVRRVGFEKITRVLFIAALILLTLAAGDVRIKWTDVGTVAVLADVSPSTRDATYWRGAARQASLRQLLGSTPYSFYTFSNDLQPADAKADLHERLAEETRFASPDNADVIVLFSDGRFTPPGDLSKPVYCIIDPRLIDPPDTSVTELSLRENQLVASINIRSLDSAVARFRGVREPSVRVIRTGSTVQLMPALDSASSFTSTLDAADAWPENNQISIRPAPPDQAERWWISTRAAPAGFTAIAPGSLPADPAAYLTAGIVLLDNLSADQLLRPQQDRLAQYVRDLGGTLVILGGNRAFGSGNYDGSTLDTLSPLAGSPPAPTVHWMLLADASGSMAAPAGETTRWQRAADAMSQVIQSLPPDDLVSVGRFAERTEWTQSGKSVRETRQLTLPTNTLIARGPTNLQQALTGLPSTISDNLEKHLLLITDGEANLTDTEAISRSLRERNIHLHLLDIGDGKAISQLQDIARATGGMSLREIDPQQWSTAARQLMQRAMPDRWENRAIDVSVPEFGIQRSIAGFNRTWLKQGAEQLSHGEPPLAARWQAGQGRVAALAFEASPDDARRITGKLATAPTDPRLKIEWKSDSPLRVSIDALDRDQLMNGLPFSLRLGDEKMPIPQTGPGRYELSFPSPRSPQIATLMQDDRIIQHRALAGRYAPEFDQTGVDRLALRDLANRTGGAVIEPENQASLQLKWPAREASLTSWLALAGFIALGVALLRAG